MRLTKQRLREIINEELSHTINEAAGNEDSWIITWSMRPQSHVRVPKTEAQTPQEAIEWRILDMLQSDRTTSQEKSWYARHVDEGWWTVMDGATWEEVAKDLSISEEFFIKHNDLLCQHDPEPPECD